MKAKLIKSDIQYRLHNEEGIVIATSTDGKLSIKNCESIANGYDLDELAESEAIKISETEVRDEKLERIYKRGFQKALEILGDKKFSKDDIKKMMKSASYGWFESDFDKHLATLQETEWDVEIVMDKDCYSRAGRCDKLTMADCIICTPVIYLKDADGCLILRKI